MSDLREDIDNILRAELITIGISVEDAKTGQMWAFDSERLSKKLLSKVKEHYVELDSDQSLPKEIISCGFGCEELLKEWRRIKE